MDREQLAVADLHGDRERTAHGVAIVGLQADRRHAGISALGDEDQCLAVRAQPRRAVRGPRDGPIDRIVFAIDGQGVQGHRRRQVDVRRQHRVAVRDLCDRGLVGLPAVVGVEHLAIQRVDEAVAIQVGLRAALSEQGAVCTVDVTVAIQVARDRDLDRGRTRASQRQQLEAGFSDAQQRDRRLSRMGLAQYRRAKCRQCGVPGRANGNGDGTTGARRANGRVDFALTHGEREIHRDIRAQRAAPGVRAHGGVRQPVDGGAEVGRDGIGDQGAIGVIAVSRSAAGAVQLASQNETPLRVVGVGDRLGRTREIGARHQGNAPLGIAFEVNAFGSSSRAHEDDARVAYEPLLSIGESHCLHLPLGVQAVASAVRTGQDESLRLPRKPADLVVQALALTLQRRRCGFVSIIGAQRPAVAAREVHAGHHRRASCRAECDILSLQREAQRLQRGAGLREADRKVQPDTRALQPGRLRPQRRHCVLVRRQVGVQQWHRPVAEVVRRPTLGVGTRGDVLREVARQRERMVAKLEGRVRRFGLHELLVGRIDQHARVDLAGAATQIPSRETQREDAVDQHRGVQRGQSLQPMGIHRRKICLGQRGPCALVDRAAVRRCNLEFPSHQLQIVH